MRLGALSQRVVVPPWGLRMGDICVLGSKGRGSPALGPGGAHALGALSDGGEYNPVPGSKPGDPLPYLREETHSDQRSQGNTRPLSRVPQACGTLEALAGKDQRASKKPCVKGGRGGPTLRSEDFPALGPPSFSRRGGRVLPGV